MSALFEAPAADAGAVLARYVDPAKDAVRVSVHADAGTESVVVPMAAFRLFTEILDAMARGEDVEAVRVPPLVSVAQAADKLNVSQEYVGKLLDEGKLPSRPVGSARMIPYRDLLAFKTTSDAECRRALEELVALGQEMGLE